MKKYLQFVHRHLNLIIKKQEYKEAHALNIKRKTVVMIRGGFTILVGKTKYPMPITLLIIMIIDSLKLNE